MGVLLQELASYASFLALLGQVLFVWAMWSLKKSFVPLDTYNQKIVESEQRIAKLETRLESVAQPDIHPLELGLTELRGELKALTKALEMQGSAMGRMEENTGQAMNRIEKTVHMLTTHHMRENR